MNEETQDSKIPAPGAVASGDLLGISLRIENLTLPMYVCEVRGVIFVTFTVELEHAARFPTDKADPERWRETIELIAGVPLSVVMPNAKLTCGS